MLLDLLKPQSADKILIKIADLGNACWVVSCSSTKTEDCKMCVPHPWQHNAPQSIIYFENRDIFNWHLDLLHLKLVGAMKQIVRCFYKRPCVWFIKHLQPILFTEPNATGALRRPQYGHIYCALEWKTQLPYVSSETGCCGLIWDVAWETCTVQSCTLQCYPALVVMLLIWQSEKHWWHWCFKNTFIGNLF